MDCFVKFYGEQERMFFSEEKNQKTFDSGGCGKCGTLPAKWEAARK
jgi:hypothetical protein